MTTFLYPFASDFFKQFAEVRARGDAVDEWRQPGFDMQATVNGIDSPILEIGGPSDQGYYFLHDIELPSKVIISNITKDSKNNAPNADQLRLMVEMIIDGRTIPYQDGSIGMVLSSHLSRVDEPAGDLSTMTDEQQQAWTDRLERSQAAIDHAVKTGSIDAGELNVSLRFSVAQEVWRVLRPGGLYLTDATAQEVKLYECMGFTKLAHIDRLPLDYGASYYDVVLRKPQ